VALTAGPVALIVLVLASLLACHPMLNPADPGSTAYLGEPVDTSPDPDADPAPMPEPLLPAVARWELVATHDPGVDHALTIPDDDSFVEPRASTSFRLRMTLSDSFEFNAGASALLWTAFADSAGEYYEFTGMHMVEPDTRRLTVDLRAYTMARGWVRLVDRNGAILGERVFAFLAGDVNGDGVVEAGLSEGTDQRAISDLDGFVPSPSMPATIRADTNMDGMVGEAGDWVSFWNGNTVPADPPAFLD
jgi:hypothetical protein